MTKPMIFLNQCIDKCSSVANIVKNKTILLKKNAVDDDASTDERYMQSKLKIKEIDMQI